MVDWFLGPYPHSQLRGETPAEQIIEGGLSAVGIMLDDLDAFVGDKGRAAGVPPRHYDLKVEGS